MARNIAVRVGRVWQSLTGSPIEATGVVDSVTVDFVPGSGGLGASQLGTSALGG